MKFIFLTALLLASTVYSVPATNWVTPEQLLDANNAIRANPKILVNYIQTEFLDKMNCTTGVLAEWGLKFSEKCVAIKEAIAVAKTLAPVQQMKLDEGLQEISKKHSDYQVSVPNFTRSKMTHYGKTGQSPDVYKLSARLKVNNEWRTTVRENIINASPVWSQTAMRVMAMLFIDNGVSNRGHRTNMMYSSVNTVGFGITPFTFEGKKYDRITMLYAAAPSCCKKTICPFNYSQRSTFYFNNIPASKINPPCK